MNQAGSPVRWRGLFCTHLTDGQTEALSLVFNVHGCRETSISWSLLERNGKGVTWAEPGDGAQTSLAGAEPALVSQAVLFICPSSPQIRPPNFYKWCIAARCGVWVTGCCDCSLLCPPCHQTSCRTSSVEAQLASLVTCAPFWLCMTVVAEGVHLYGGQWLLACGAW